MKNKDTGEFELVVGDKQLLSAFFIGVVLLAVVFALGYVLGNNSPKSAKVAPETASTAPSSQPVEARPQPASTPVLNTEPVPFDSTAPPSAQTAGAEQPPAAVPVEAPPQPTTMPARDSGAPARTAAAAPPAVKAAPDPANATYWQILATASRNSADAMFQTLKGQGFPATTRMGPNNLTVVWVGPYSDKESLARAKKQLEDAGFNNIIRKP
jgi:cell division septation protein DedD